MPNLSPTMEEGNLVEWYKKEGDLVKEGEAIASIETDKSTLDFEMVEDGYLAKILVSEGSQGVKVGTLVAIMVEEEEDLAAFADYKEESAPVKEQPATPEPTESVVEEVKPAQTATQTSSQTVSKQSDPSDRQFASPLARRTARDMNIDINGIKGSGPNSRVIAADVLEYTPAQEIVSTTAAVGTADYTDIPVTNIRKIVAKRLTESKSTVPHYYLNIEAEVDSFLKMRSELNKESGVKISVNDMIIKAASIACVKVPECNSSWSGEYIRQFNNADISVAAQTEHGLITPIVPRANQKGIESISKEMKGLISKAQENKLLPHEFQGGTFSISNLGMFGINQFNAIINPPHACNLAVGTSYKKVVETEEGQFKSISN